MEPGSPAARPPIVVGRPAGQGSIGAYGFGYYTVNNLNGRNKYHRGYPTCYPGEPQDCWFKSLYGDNAMGNVSGRSLQAGWYRVLDNDSDVNLGHSGGPAYVYDSGVKVFGVQAVETSQCYGSTEGDDCPPEARPNRMRRIDPTWYGAMLNFIGQYPN